MSDHAQLLDDPALAPPRAVRPSASRRLGLVALYFAYRFAASLLIATPFAALLSRPVAHAPRGDAVLWDPGATMLLETLRLSGRGALGAGSASLLLTIVVTFLGLLPFAALVAGLGRQGRLPASYLASRAVAPVGTLALLWGASLVAQVILGALVILLGTKVIMALHFTARGEDIARLALAAVALVAAAAIGVLRDIAAVSAIDDSTRFYTSAARAIGVAGHAPGHTALAYASRSVPAAVAVGAAAWAVTFRGDAGSPSIALPLVLHQAAIAAAAFLHASWLAAAIRLVNRFAPLAPLAPLAPPPPREEPARPALAAEPPHLPEEPPTEAVDKTDAM